ncbi:MULTISPECIES: small acid-soluble spore protein Tlp [Bacillus cereus group]|uniref:small acid-soluble spore protein Tlp n=1 Tax=Bacillus cereus group TaxID=86661 RepID=UPI001298C76F|nr:MULTISPECIES: small acid-soluble spore protein Tlp [Bacillus cereus group]MCR6786395.1 small acid-soluble spore protein Tlp [Bacillus thuringiensis]MCR6823920.1 small acid-soluble spore protein Tlp [Bacillus thuringiensis]MCR6828471.1 small acid-soluble spore protein Tlp [Bacillus thuringiensis]MEB8929542.1 small acid-soluble spore protein Tlp [Bacillus cereus]MEB9327130.1 small acid-soluble spore protein Tlp [Bacillus cereus]
MPNPDNRSDNAEKLQEMVQNTVDNFNEAKETTELSNEKDRAAIEAKNQRRLESIDSLKSEIKDES